MQLIVESIVGMGLFLENNRLHSDDSSSNYAFKNESYEVNVLNILNVHDAWHINDASYTMYAFELKCMYAHAWSNPISRTQFN